MPSMVKLLFRGRCPPTDGPLPTPTPPLLATPEPRRERFRTPPLGLAELGNSAASCEEYVLVTWDVVVSMMAAAVETSTLLDTVPTCMERFTVLVTFRATATP